MTLDRRGALVRLGLACAAIASGRRAAGVSTLAALEPDDLLSLAARIRDGSRDAAWDAAAAAIRAGATPMRVLGAVFLAGVESIRPRPHGILHAVMMVESACQLADADAGSGRAAFHPALFNLDDLKTAQHEDRLAWADYEMKPLVANARGGPEAAKRELSAALDSFDPGRAEHAAANLATLVDAASFFDLVRPYTVRCYAFIGHKAIYAAQVERALARVGWEHGGPAVRSLVLALLVDRDSDGFERSWELARRLPAAPDAAGPGRAGDSEELLTALRSARPAAAAAAAVASAMRSGVPAAAAWDAILLHGAELFERRTGRRAVDGRAALLPVHAVTVPSALRQSAGRTRDAATRGLLLLRAAEWVARLRDDLDRIVGLTPAAAGALLAGGGGTVAGAGRAAQTIEAVLESASPAHAAAWLEVDAARSEALLRAMRRSLARRGREHHQHKLAAAMAEEANAVHASFRPRLLAPAVDYLANPRDPDTEVFGRAQALLDAAGVRG